MWPRSGRGKEQPAQANTPKHKRLRAWRKKKESRTRFVVAKKKKDQHRPSPGPAKKSLDHPQDAAGNGRFPETPAKGIQWQFQKHPARRPRGRGVAERRERRNPRWYGSAEKKGEQVRYLPL